MFPTKDCLEKCNKKDRSPSSQKGYDGPILPHLCLYLTIIGLGFCDIQNNQGRGKGCQPKPKAEADKYQDLDYSGYHKNRI